MKRKILLTAIALSVASGCTSMHSEKLREEASKINSEVIGETGKQIETNKKEFHTKQTSLASQVLWHDTPVLSTEKRVLKTKLPDVFKQKVTIDEIFEVELKDLFSRINETTGLEISMENDVIDESAIKNNQSQAAKTISPTDSTGMPMMMPVAGPSAGTVNAYMIKISYSGTIDGLMTTIASKLNARWRYDAEEKKVVIYKYVDDQFYIPSIPGSSKSVASLNDTVSDSNRQAEFSVNTNLWDTIRENMKVFIDDGDGGYFSLSESTGTLSVRTTPEAMKRVKAYIDDVKKSLRSQVLLDVQIYSVNMEDSENREVNFQTLLESNGWGATLAAGAESTLTGPTSFILNTLRDSPNVGPGAAFNIKEGSTGMINILNKAGKTNLLQSVPMRTINNQPVAVSATVTDSYLSKSEVTTDPTTGVQNTSLTTEKNKVGLSLNVLPTLDENGRDLMLQVAFSLSDIINYRTFETIDGSKSITPVINSRDFIDKVWLKSGQTLMLTGFELNKAEENDSSPFGSGAWYAGGAKNKKITKEKLVIVITPRVYNAVTQTSL
jgi:Flp pilus assembly secretin CpaC